MAEHKGARYNAGKNRIELLPSYALQEIGKVFTYGAEKYTRRDDNGKVIYSGDNNWKNGLGWMGVMASAKRHIELFISGEDRDKESLELHLAHAATNLMFLLEFYRIYPQGDDRPHNYLKFPKIGLDVDEVLADFVGPWSEKHNHEIPTWWNFDREMAKKLEDLKDDREFWLSLPVKTPPAEIPFEPHCYITSRVIPKEITEEWLHKNGFPAAPVYSLGVGKSKVDAAKEADIDIFVDDSMANFVQLNKAGICTYLFDARHNQRYDVGYRRIKHLRELVIPGFAT
jgi:5'(3')-deoxyribonucleotidase